MRLTLIFLALYMGASIVLGTVAYVEDRDQQKQLNREQAISIAAICAAAKVIRHEPQGSPATAQGESRREFEHRLALYHVFLAGAKVLNCP